MDNLEREYRDCIKSRRQDWDHKAYHNAITQYGSTVYIGMALVWPAL